MYHPGLGTFIERDPIDFDSGDWNLYRYCGNRPTNATDPTGFAATPTDLLVTSASYVGVPSLSAFEYVIPRINLTFSPRAAGMTWRQDNRTQIDFLDAKNTVRARIIVTVVDLMAIPGSLKISDTHFSNIPRLVSYVLKGAIARGALSKKICSYEAQSSSKIYVMGAPKTLQVIEKQGTPPVQWEPAKHLITMGNTQSMVSMRLDMIYDTGLGLGRDPKVGNGMPNWEFDPGKGGVASVVGQGDYQGEYAWIVTGKIINERTVVQSSSGIRSAQWATLNTPRITEKRVQTNGPL
jgi:hypothetical protein